MSVRFCPAVSRWPSGAYALVTILDHQATVGGSREAVAATWRQ